MRTELLRSMLGALSDVKNTGNTYEMSESWEVTLHAAHDGAGLTVTHVTRIVVEADYLTAETTRGTRWIVASEHVYAIGQEPSRTEQKGRKTGFA